MMGDFTKPQYVMRRQALEEELQRTKPPVTPALDRAKALLEDFGTLWQAEQDPIERRKLIATLFEQIWQKDGAIVAVKPRSAFARYFTTVEEARSKRPKAGLNSGVTKAGATGVEPCPDTAHRMPYLAGVLRNLSSGASQLHRAAQSCARCSPSRLWLWLGPVCRAASAPG
jgi:hypothetical protein